MKAHYRKWLEILAVLNSLAYTLLYTYDSIWCWPFSILASIIFLVLCIDRRIYAESLLHFFYIFTSIYGYRNWGEGLSSAPAELDLSTHGLIILSAAALTLVSAWLLRRYSDAAQPLIDSFTTVFSIFGTLLMIQLYPSNWLYWIVIDAVSVYLYFSRGLYYTAVLFIIYTALAVNGYLQWL